MSAISEGIGDIEQLDENLRKWFKEKWVRFGPDGKIRGACARGDDSEGKPKCLPQKKAQNLGKKGRKYAASKKRREDPNPERTGKAKNVATKKKTNEGVPFDECPKCRGPIVHESMMTEKQDACYHKVKSRYKVWPSAYASGALVQCRKKGASNWGTGGKKDESSIMKGIVDEGVIISATDNGDPRNPQVAVLGGAGSYSFENLKKKALGEAKQLAADIASGEYKNSAYNVKQLANTLNTIVAAEEEMEKLYFGEDYTGQFAAEKTPAINPYGGLKDNKFRGGISEDELDEACWKGYHKEGNKKMFGKTYPNCVKNTNEEQLDELSPDLLSRAQQKAHDQKQNIIDKAKSRNIDLGSYGDPKGHPVAKAAFAKDEQERKFSAGARKASERDQDRDALKDLSPAMKRKIGIEEEQLDEKCWDSHKQVGMKNKGGRQVPNCVPKESAILKGLKSL